MSSRKDENETRSKRKRSRRRRRHGHRDEEPEGSSVSLGARDQSLLADLDESLLTPEERAYKEAREAAERKVALYRRMAKLAIVAVPLLIFIPFVGAIVVVVGGIDLARKGYRDVYEPRLRDRLIGDEVRKRVQTSVFEERRSLEGEHARSLERLSASIAHEIRNPITAAKSLVQQMGEDPAGVDNVEYAQVALQELKRVERSISHLLRYAREEEMRSAPLAMSEILESALETFRDRAEREGVEIVRQFDCEGRMLGDAEQLRRVAINLIGNAMDALLDAHPEKPRVGISMGENLAGNEIWVRIEDNGLGMDDTALDRIFNPFVTSKEHGTGLGLPITRKIVEAHAGMIEVDSVQGEGTEFVLSFPKGERALGDRA